MCHGKTSNDTSPKHIITCHFPNQYTINRKVCNLLVNSGYKENIISWSVVVTLKLKTSKYAQPYKISWWKKISFQMCRVTFSIRKYFICDVLCNVIEMDVCHLIFGKTITVWYWSVRSKNLRPPSQMQDPRSTKRGSSSHIGPKVNGFVKILSRT